MKRQITRGTTIVLEAVLNPDVLTQPLFAINWFNTRSRWLYHFYNMVASSSVFKVGAKVLLKGRVTETLSGSPENAREVLLIVNYPSGERFLDLLADRYFQLTSLLRMLAVRDFSFVMNRRLGGPELLEHQTQPFNVDHAWAVHHYSSVRDIDEEFQTLCHIARENGVVVHFSSYKAVTVNVQDRHGTCNTINHVTDRVVILEADSENQLRTAINGPYREFTESVQNSYIGVLHRTL